MNHQTIKVQKYYEMDYYEQVSLGLWRGDCSKLAANNVTAYVENHHGFAVNWIDHKSNEIFNHVNFMTLPKEPRAFQKNAIDVRLLGKDCHPKDIVTLEKHGAEFIKDEHYNKKLWGVFKELGT